jgi:hypothetical protein
VPFVGCARHDFGEQPPQLVVSAQYALAAEQMAATGLARR